MIPFVYFEIDLHREIDIPMHDSMSQLVACAHQFMSQGNKMALAFPKCSELPGLGDKLRFFAEQQDVLESFKEMVKNNKKISSLGNMSRIKNVPEDVDVKECYCRFQIPNKKLSKKHRNDPYYIEIQEKRRKRRIAQAQSLPFVQLTSISSKQRFWLHIERMACPADCYGEPDSYGLSRSSNIVSLPVIY